MKSELAWVLHGTCGGFSFVLLFSAWEARGFSRIQDPVWSCDCKISKKLLLIDDSRLEDL